MTSRGLRVGGRERITRRYVKDEPSGFADFWESEVGDKSYKDIEDEHRKIETEFPGTLTNQYYFKRRGKSVSIGEESEGEWP